MRRFSSLPWFLIVMGSTVLAAAGPGAPVRSRTQKEAEARKAETKKQPTPAPRTASAPAAKKPAASKPSTAKVEPKRTAPIVSAPARPATKPAVVTVAAAAPPVSREIPRSVASVEPTNTRRVLREWDLWLGGVQSQQAEFADQLKRGSEEVERIQNDPSLAALPSDRNRNEAAIPAAAAVEASAQRDWRRQLSGAAGRPAPVQVEALMKQGETIAFRTSTSTGDTQGLVAKIRRTPGVQAGGHLGLEAAAPDLMIAHLRKVPGSSIGGPVRMPYAVQNVDDLRARMERGRQELAAQFDAVRAEWLATSTRANELQQKYMELRAKLVARDEE
jgi:hypothetical protein